ncbi:MAG: DUF4350 domain-containing protein [Haloferacaceae archaeon]
MEVRGREVTYPRLLLAAVVLVTLSAFVFAVGTSAAAFGSYNHGWDGSSDLRSLAGDADADVHVARSTAAYRTGESDRTTAFVLGPTDSYGESDVGAMSSFLDRGGTVVVAADGGSQSNRLLEALGVESRFDGRQLRDEQRSYRNPALPVASPVGESSLTRDVSQVTLNHATVVRPADDGSVLVNSSSFSYLDANENAELDDSEPVREYPVVVREERGNGSVILVSDASVFINAMLERPDNRQFARNLLTDSEAVLFDYSHRDGVPTAVALARDASASPLVQWMTVVAFVGVAGVAWRTAPGLPDRFAAGATADSAAEESSYEAVVARLADEYPEWDDERIERVARSMTRDGPR